MGVCASVVKIYHADDALSRVKYRQNHGNTEILVSYR